MTRAALPLLLSALLVLGGCNRHPDDTPVTVSAIGGPAKLADPSHTPLPYASKVLMGATAQGLVRFDAAGQVEPALAERWIVIDGGRSYIFRLRDAQWPDGTDVTADAVVRVLEHARARGSRNPLAPFLAVVDDFRAMTPQVVEIDLNQPRPDFLRLLASPELAIFQPGTLRGSGPFRLNPDDHAGRLLVPVRDMSGDEGDDAAPNPEEQVRLFGDRSSLAIARFAEGDADLVIGGTFADWPILDVSGVETNARHIDPATGLFGLRVTSRGGFLADADNRAAIAMAIDRVSLLDSFRPDWPLVETVLPQQLDSAQAPAVPDWADRPLDERRNTARARVAIWKADRARRNKTPVPPIRVALPKGPGGNLVWNHVARALNAIGLPAQRVPMRDDADLTLIDRVAPFDNARWYLLSVCGLCSPDTKKLITDALDAPDLQARSQRIAKADEAVTAEAAYIPLAQPLRWSLVSPRLSQWQANARAWHPLNHLRDDTR
ncbi:ABC transporter substrate-binding protein [Stakelama marina]|uniref:ABC transporter substrate-binding protein n=1 Tax=Stakelama marina TaxID=2826939 RepID=A0A8T4ICJ6_9SPHN|nr:ABC transporter substrate-binding protein [Stakelama marina]MBR0552121.1 ABC transporter substrate-binding protein [Stakelama marina]